MSQSSKEKILTAAENCFFQHGYQKTNMSLVSKYSGFSRVTVHKHFCTKKHLLRAVFRNHYESNLSKVEKHIAENPEYTPWQAIEYMTEIMAHPIFERISDLYILEDLEKACKEHGEDIRIEMKASLVAFMKKHIDRGVSEGSLCLDKVGIDSQELALLLDNSLEGIILNTQIKKTRTHVDAMFKVYKVATLPN